MLGSATRNSCLAEVPRRTSGVILNEVKDLGRKVRSYLSTEILRLRAQNDTFTQSDTFAKLMNVRTELVDEHKEHEDDMSENEPRERGEGFGAVRPEGEAPRT